MIQSMGVREQQQQLLDAAAMVEGVARSLGNHGAVCRHCGLIRYDDLEVHREVQGLMEAAKKLRKAAERRKQYGTTRSQEGSYQQASGRAVAAGSAG